MVDLVYDISGNCDYCKFNKNDNCTAKFCYDSCSWKLSEEDKEGLKRLIGW